MTTNERKKKKIAAAQGGTTDWAMASSTPAMVNELAHATAYGATDGERHAEEGGVL